MRSLRGYLVGMAVTLVLLICVVAALLIGEVDRFGRRQAEEQLLSTSRALSTAVDGELHRAAGVLLALNASEAMQRRDWAAVDRQARAAVPGEDRWVVVGDRSGRQLVNTRQPPGSPLPTGTNPVGLWRLLDSGRPRICDLTRGYVERHIVCVDMPVMENGRAAYVLSVVMRPRLFGSIIAQQRVRGGNVAALLDRRGTVIWRNINPERFVGQPATVDVRAAVAQNFSGMRESRSLDQVRMLGAFSRSPLSGWTFIVGVPLDVAEAGGFRALSFGLLAALGFLLLGAAIALAVARRLTGAIGRLSATAAQFRDGGDARFRPSGLAEIDEVGAALEAAFAAREASEERFALAQEVGGIGAWDWDTVRDRGHVSDAYKAMHGLSHVVGPLCLNQLLDVIHPDDLEGYSARLAAARSTPEPSTNEYRVVHADGTVRWIAAKGRPVFDENGHHVRAVGVVRDVTADREAERELRRLNEQLEARVEARTAELAESERRFRGIFDTSFQLTGLGTLDGTVLLVNQAALDAVGATQEQVRGLKMWDAPWWAATPAEAVRVREALGDAVQGRFVRYEAQLNLPGGPRTFDFSMKPLLGDGGAPTLLIAEGRDITELKQTEEALRQSQKLESMGQLTGGVAHDFNNLLTPIVGSLDMLQRRGVGGDREQRLIAGALQSAEKATMLVQRLLAFARRQPLQPTAVDLAKLVAGMTELIASTSGPRIRLTADLRPDLPPVTADPNQVEMAILNLAVNARDAMPDGGSLTIAAHAEEVGAGESASLAPGAYVRLSVSDTGTGMDEATRARAIEPFFSTKGVGKGTGLGLSMVHGLAGQLGGALTIDSRPGLGTTVALWLPVAAERPVEGGAADVAAATASVGNVLLVDDDDLARASTAEMLADLGYAVVEAVSGEDALRLADAGMTFDLLVTDHLMPGLTGAELARTVMKRRPGTPVLIISGYAEVDGIAPDLHRLSKPFRQVDLASRVAELLNAAAPQRAQPC